ncbi:MAG: hypothetical protein JXA97_13405 [Anaerolineales bacterium]|nr:hypothetical protein [Anaerolineales bacterium]
MPSKSVRLALLTLLFLALVLYAPPPDASADIGPKPTMAFSWDLSAWETAPLIGQVNLYACGDDVSCSEPQLVEEMGAQRMTCDESGCFAMLYSSGGYWQLEVQINDGILLSEPFEKIGYDSDYRVVFHPDRMEIVHLPPPDSIVLESGRSFESSALAVTLISLGLALTATLAIELIIAAVFIKRKSLPWRLLALTLLGNIITVPIVWLFVPGLFGDIYIAFALQFMTAFLLESMLYRILGGKSLAWRGSFQLSFWTNLGSEFIGLGILVLLSQIV